MQAVFWIKKGILSSQYYFNALPGVASVSEARARKLNTITFINYMTVPGAFLCLSAQGNPGARTDRPWTRKTPWASTRLDGFD